jgi:hypothetical protein
MKFKHLTTLLAGIMLIGLASCEYSTIVPEEVVIPDEPVSFSTEIEPVFTSAGCVSCHPKLLKPDLTAGKAYASITSMNLVVAGDPGASKLMQYINAGHQTSSNITPTQKALISKWITEGAKNN